MFSKVLSTETILLSTANKIKNAEKGKGHM